MLLRVSLFLKSIALAPGTVSGLLGTASGLGPRSWGQAGRADESLGRGAQMQKKYGVIPAHTTSGNDR